MASQRRRIESAIERASSNGPLVAALNELVQLQAELDIAPTTTEVETLRRIAMFAASAASTVEADLVDTALAEELRSRCVAARSSISYAQSDPVQVSNASDMLRQPVRKFVAIAGSITTKTNAIVSSLLLAVEVHSGFETALADAQAETAALRSAHENGVKEWADWRAGIDDEFTDFSDGWNKWKDGEKQSFDVWLKERDDELEAERVSITKAGVELSEQADLLLAKLRETLGLAADASLSVGYSHQADAEAKLATADKAKAVRFGLAAAVVAGVGVGLQYVAAAEDWHLSQAAVVPAKLAVIAALAAISRYFAVNATAHRNYAQQLRTTGLELNNVGNYLAELPVQERAEVRRQLVPTFFGQQPTVHAESAPITSDSVGAVFTAFAEMAARLPKP